MLAQVLCGIGNLIKIIAIQFKDKKKILFCFCFVNLFVGLGIYLLSGLTGALVCFVAVIQTFINYLYCGKKLPKFLIPIYVIVSLLIGFSTCHKLLDLFPIVCSLLYIASICQKDEKNLRLLSFFNILLWIIYNFTLGAYTDVIFKIIFLVSNLISIYKFDIKKKR